MCTLKMVTLCYLSRINEHVSIRAQSYHTIYQFLETLYRVANTTVSPNVYCSTPLQYWNFQLTFYSNKCSLILSSISKVIQLNSFVMHGTYHYWKYNFKWQKNSLLGTNVWVDSVVSLFGSVLEMSQASY